MNVVAVSEWLPYPARSGGQIRTLHLLERLARRHRVTLLCRGRVDGEGEKESVAHLRGLGIDVEIADRPPRPSGRWRWCAALAANLASPLPHAVASHNSQAVRAAVRRLAATRKVDLWQFEWLAYLDALPRERRRQAILMAPNVESLLCQRHYQATRGPLRRWYVAGQWRKYERVEKQAFTRAARVVVVSHADAQQARERFQAENVAVVENGIDRRFFQEVVPRRVPGRILFLGSLDWRPNLDAIDRLLKYVFPIVRRTRENAELWLVGKAPPPTLARRVEKTAGARLFADVADVRPFLAEASVLTVPLRIGGGSRLKILEALATGLPVVASTVGAEGLNLTPGEHFDLADSDEDHAHALVEVLQNPEAARARAENGRQFVLNAYDWDALAEKLETVWHEVRRECA